MTKINALARPERRALSSPSLRRYTYVLAAVISSSSLLRPGLGRDKRARDIEGESVSSGDREAGLRFRGKIKA